MLRVQTTHCAALNKLKANGRDTVPKAWWMQDQEQEGGNCEFSFPKKGGLLIDCDTKIVYVETLSQIGEPMYTEMIWLQPTESSNISTYLVVPFFKLQWILYEKVAKTYWKSNSAWNNFSSITVVYDIERELVVWRVSGLWGASFELWPLSIPALFRSVSHGYSHPVVQYLVNWITDLRSIALRTSEL